MVGRRRRRRPARARKLRRGTQMLRVRRPAGGTLAVQRAQPAAARSRLELARTLLQAGAGGEVKAERLAGDAPEVAPSIGMDDSAVLLFALGRIPESDMCLSFSGGRAIAGRPQGVVARTMSQPSSPP